MNQCAHAAAASTVTAVEADYQTKEDNLIDRFDKAIDNLNGKLQKKMPDWEVRMQHQWCDLENRWRERFSHQESDSSDSTISVLFFFWMLEELEDWANPPDWS